MGAGDSERPATKRCRVIERSAIMNEGELSSGIRDAVRSALRTDVQIDSADIYASARGTTSQKVGVYKTGLGVELDTLSSFVGKERVTVFLENIKYNMPKSD